jgi:glycosyltransferase involved in cell wall biosynthesis
MISGTSLDKQYLLVTTHYAPDFHYGGVVQCCYDLLPYLNKYGIFRISAVSKNPMQVKKYMAGKGHCYKSNFFHRYGLSVPAVFGLWRDVKMADIIYIAGTLPFPTTLAQIYAVLQKKPFAVATHGLTAWSMNYKKWRKLLYFSLLLFPLMRKAKFIHITSVAEERLLKLKGFTNTLMISNGISLEEFNDLPSRDDNTKFVFLFLGRMGKEKGLDILIQAYREFCNTFGQGQHKLLLVGPDLQGYLKSLSINYANENIEYNPGVYGPDKLHLIRNADVVVLPSYSENFGNVVAEAFACERPVITTTGTPWKEIETVGCGLYVTPDVSALLDAIKVMYQKTPAEREQMGKRGRSYVFANFDWEKKAKEIFDHLQA